MGYDPDSKKQPKGKPAPKPPKRKIKKKKTVFSKGTPVPGTDMKVVTGIKMTLPKR